MKTRLPFDVEMCVACEDVREEKSGKHTLIGLYTGDILISAIPGIIPMSFFMQFNVKKPGRQTLTLRLSGPGDNSIALKAQIELPEGKPQVVLRTPRMDVLIEEEGTFRLDISTDEKSWTNLVTKELIFNPSVSTSFQPQLAQSPPDVPETSSPPEPSPQGSPRKRRRS